MNLLRITFIVTIPFLPAGCITRRTMQDEPRQTVAFADTYAAKTFYDTYLALNHPSEKSATNIFFGVPFPYHHYVVPSENVHFNAAVKIADADQDGTITDIEADNYAKKLKPSGT